MINILGIIFKCTIWLLVVSVVDVASVCVKERFKDLFSAVICKKVKFDGKFYY